jgi:hypothetical protein
MRNVIVEVYLLSLKIVHSKAPNNYTEMQFSKASTVKEVKEQACKRMGWDISKVKVFNYYYYKAEELALDKPLEDFFFNEGQKVLFEDTSASSEGEAVV